MGFGSINCNSCCIDQCFVWLYWLVDVYLDNTYIGLVCSFLDWNYWFGERNSQVRLFFILYLMWFVTVLLVFTNNARAHPRPPKYIAKAIRQAFGFEYFREALHVSWCESRFRLNATNGQYRGLFQLGAPERQIYGHGPTALQQSNAASRYFRASGKDWSPWDSRCRP